MRFTKKNSLHLSFLAAFGSDLGSVIMIILFYPTNTAKIVLALLDITLNYSTCK